MSLETTASRVIYSGNGSTKVFSFSFKVWKPSQVRVMLADSEGAETDVTSQVVVALTATGGTVSFASAPAVGTTLAILRSMPFVQEDRYITGTRFDPHEIEDALDIACAERQELRESVVRSVKVPATDKRTPEQYAADIFNARDDVQDMRDDVQDMLAEVGTEIGNHTIVTAEGGTEGRTLASRFADVINVKDFGAKGDGVTGDTVAIQAALDAGLVTGKAVYFPSGVYHCSENIDVEVLEKGKNSLTIVGDSAVLYSTFKPPHWTSADRNADLVPFIRFAGKRLLDSEPIPATINKGATKLAVTGNLSQVTEGDIIVIRSNRLIVGDNRGFWKEGQIFKVEAIRDGWLYLGDTAVTDFVVSSSSYTYVEDAGATVQKFKFAELGEDTTQTIQDLRYPMYCTQGNNLGEHMNVTQFGNGFVWFNTGWGDNTNEDDNRHPFSNIPNAGDIYTINRTVECDVYHPIQVSITGVKIVRDRVLKIENEAEDYRRYRGLIFEFAENVSLSDIEVSNFIHTNLLFERSINCVVEKSIFNYANLIIEELGGTGHGIDFSGANIRVSNCYMRGNRGAITTAGHQFYATNCVVSDCTVFGGALITYAGHDVFPNGSNYNTYGLDAHGNGYNLTYRNNNIRDCTLGSSTHGQNVSIIGNVFGGRMMKALVCDKCTPYSAIGNKFYPESGDEDCFLSVHMGTEVPPDVTFIGNEYYNARGYAVYFDSTRDITGLKIHNNIVNFAIDGQRFFGTSKTGSRSTISKSSFTGNILHYPGSTAIRTVLNLPITSEDTTKIQATINSYVEIDTNVYGATISNTRTIEIPVRVSGQFYPIHVEVMSMDGTVVGTAILHDYHDGVTGNLYAHSVLGPNSVGLHVRTPVGSSDFVNDACNIWYNMGTLFIHNRFSKTNYYKIIVR